MSHTKGPWRVKRMLNISDRDPSVITETRYAITAGKRDGPHKNVGHFHPSNAEYFIEEMYVVDTELVDGEFYSAGIEKEDDALLIAAAPDLLEACQLALHAFEDGWCIDWNVLSSAISRATGVHEKREKV